MPQVEDPLVPYSTTMLDLSVLGLQHNGSYGEPIFYEDSDLEDRLVVITQDMPENTMRVGVRLHIDPDNYVGWENRNVELPFTAQAVAEEMALFGYQPAINYLRVQKIDRL